MRDPALSPREREVAALVAEGLTNKQIAERLFISERTAEGHLEQARNKLGFHSRSQVAAWAASQGAGVRQVGGAPPPASVATAPDRPARSWRRPALAVALAAAVVLVIALALVRPTPPPTVVVVAGLGMLGFSGDGGPAIAAQLDRPVSLAFDPDGTLYLADSTFQLGRGGVRESYTRIRRVDRTGTIQTIAGGGTRALGETAFGPDLRLSADSNIAFDASSGLLYFSRQSDPVGEQWVGAIDLQQRVRVIVSTTGANGYAGDGGPATAARLSRPRGLAVAADGTLYIADSGNNVIRAVARDGTIDTVAGNGQRGDSGDGGPPRKAALFAPTAVAVSPDGSVFIADTNNNRVRMIDHGGRMLTVAGNGHAGFAGDGGPATAAELNLPSGLAFDSAGTLYIADAGNNRIRRVTSGGTIATVVGDGSTATLQGPLAVAVDARGEIYVADTENHRVLRLPR